MAKDNENITELTTRRAADVLTTTDRDSVGVVRILSDSAGTPGEEREYRAGDEALVEAGRAEWVVAPVHLPSAGRRLDNDAEREQTPADGVEAYPPAEPTTPQRRGQARREGVVEAHSDSGVAEKLAAARVKAAREETSTDGDAKTQAELGGLNARSGPVTASGDLTPAKLAEGSAADPKADTSDTGTRRSSRNTKES